MVRVHSIMGFTYYYRCTKDGRIQKSDDGKKWKVAKNWQGKRVNMAATSIAEVEAKIARKMDNGDYNFGAEVIN